MTALAGVLLAGCGGGQSGGSRPSVNEDLQALQSKIPLLQADECYTADAHVVFPRCGKYVTQLASTVGSLKAQLAPKGARLRGEVKSLGDGINEYQRQDCGNSSGQPSATQEKACPHALITMHDSLHGMGQYLASLPTSTG